MSDYEYTLVLPMELKQALLEEFEGNEEMRRLVEHDSANVGDCLLGLYETLPETVSLARAFRLLKLDPASEEAKAEEKELGQRSRIHRLLEQLLQHIAAGMPLPEDFIVKTKSVFPDDEVAHEALKLCDLGILKFKLQELGVDKDTSNGLAWLLYRDVEALVSARFMVHMTLMKAQDRHLFEFDIPQWR